LTEAVQRAIGLSLLEARTLLSQVLETIATAVESGETVKLSSFGSFVVHKKGERVGRNPKTGQPAAISARRILVFKPSAILKQQINSPGGRAAGGPTEMKQPEHIPSSWDASGGEIGASRPRRDSALAADSFSASSRASAPNASAAFRTAFVGSHKSGRCVVFEMCQPGHNFFRPHQGGMHLQSRPSIGVRSPLMLGDEQRVVCCDCDNGARKAPAVVVSQDSRGLQRMDTRGSPFAGPIDLSHRYGCWSTNVVGVQLPLFGALISESGNLRPLVNPLQAPAIAGSNSAPAADMPGLFWDSDGNLDEVQLTSGSERPKLLVTLRRDGDDFVVRFYPEDIVVFRHNEPNALRKMCAFLRWKIISDSSGLDDTTIAAFKARNDSTGIRWCGFKARACH
jgi:integration host factor subunit alpha